MPDYGLIFDGIDLHNYNFQTTNIIGGSSIDIEQQTFDLPDVDGTKIMKQRVKEREIKIEGWTYGDQKQLTGTVEISNGGVTVKGTGTLFQSEIMLNNKIIINGQKRYVIAIDSDTSLRVDTSFTTTGTGFNISLTAESTALNNKHKIITAFTSSYSTSKILTFPTLNRSLRVRLYGKPFESSPVVGQQFNAVAYKIVATFKAPFPYAFGEDWSLDKTKGVLINGMQNFKVNALTKLISAAKHEENDNGINFYGTTLINLLGTNGQFNSNWVNFWNISYADSFMVVNDVLKFKPTSGGGIYRSGICKANKKYFGSIFVSADSTVNFNWGTEGTAQTISVTTAEKQLFKSFSPASDVSLILYGASNGTFYYIRKFLWVCLDDLGNLNPALLKYFNPGTTITYSTFASLAGVASITATDGRTKSGDEWLNELLFYVDGISTPGWSYSSGASTTKIENKGFNLLSKSNTINAFLSGGVIHISSSSTRSLLIRVKPNTQYTVYFNSFGNDRNAINFFSSYPTANQTAILGVQLTPNTGYTTFTTPSTAKYMQWYLSSDNNNNFAIFDINFDEKKIFMYEGNTNSPFEKTKLDLITFNQELFGWQGLYNRISSDGKLFKYWQHISLDSKEWSYFQSITNGKVVITPQSSITGIKPNDNALLTIKFNSLPLKIGWADIDCAGTGTLNYNVAISNSDSGWIDSINPNANEIKAFFKGWKATANNGTRYGQWQGIKSGAVTIDINYCINNLDVGFTPYQLWYQLATPTIETVNFSGDLVLYPGDNNIIVSDPLLSCEITGTKKYIEVV